MHIEHKQILIPYTVKRQQLLRFFFFFKCKYDNIIRVNQLNMTCA